VPVRGSLGKLRYNIPWSPSTCSIDTWQFRLFFHIERSFREKKIKKEKRKKGRKLKLNQRYDEMHLWSNNMNDGQEEGDD